MKIYFEHPMRLGIYGAGAFGTALAFSFYRANFCVRWISHDETEVFRINAQKSFLDTPFPKGLSLSTRLNFDNLDALLWVTPSHVFEAALLSIKNHLPCDLPLVLCTKGLFHHRFLHEVAKKSIKNPILAIAGPNLALEIAKGLHAEAVLASEDYALALKLSQELSHSAFVFHPSQDLVGVELCGVLKNIYAIGAGRIIGQKLGTNAHAAFLSKAIQEMITIGKAFGACSETFLSVAGLGDLILTGSQVASRNMSFGLALGGGEEARDFLKKRTQVTEGLEGARNMAPLIKDLDVPILQELCDTLCKVCSD